MKPKVQPLIKLEEVRAVKVDFDATQADLTNWEEKDVDLKYYNSFTKEQVHYFTVVFLIKISIGSVKISAEYEGVFKSKFSTKDEKFVDSTLLKISAPAMVFPYVRAFITTLSTNCGLPPIIIPTINFVASASNDQEEE